MNKNEVNKHIASLFEGCRFTPGVYENEITYYELLCKLAEKMGMSIQGSFDEIWKFINDYFNNLDLQNEVDIAINNLYQSGAFDKYFNQFLKQSVIRETLYYTPYAKVIPNPSKPFEDLWSAQGFCIAHRQGGRYAVHCMENETGFVRIMVYDMNTGRKLKQVDVTGGGHGNDICYNADKDRFYMTTYADATPINKILELNWDLTLTNTYSFTGTPVYGVHYYGGKYYVRRSLNTVEVYTDLTAKPTQQINLTQHYNKETIFQGICVHNGFILIPHGLPVSQTSGRTDDRVPMAQIDVYTLTGTYVRTSFIALEYEIEGIDFDGSDMYIQMNTVYSGCLLRSALFQNNKTQTSMGDLVNINPKSVFYTQEFWISETNTNYFMDGSETNPIFCFAWLMLFCGLGQKVNLTLHVKSAITRMNIIARSSTFNRINIDMENHSIPFLAVVSPIRVDLSNAIITGAYSDDYMVFADLNARITLNNVTLNNANAKYGIFLTNRASAALIDIKFLSAGTPVNYIYAGFGTRVHFSGENSSVVYDESRVLKLNEFSISKEALFVSYLYNYSGDLYKSGGVIRVDAARPGVSTISLSRVNLPCTLDFDFDNNPNIAGGPPMEEGETYVSIEFKYIKFSTIQITAITYKNKKPYRIITGIKSAGAGVNQCSWYNLFKYPV